MAKEAPLKIVEEDGTVLEIMGRHEVTNDLASLKKHIATQLKSNSKAQMVIFLYLKEEA